MLCVHGSDDVVGLGSTALVLSIAAPFGGNYWYGLTLLSPLAGGYYWKRGSREEQFAVCNLSNMMLVQPAIGVCSSLDHKPKLSLQAVT